MKLALYTDGGSRGNPGPAAWGFVIYQDGQIIAKSNGYLGHTTNNVAEYTACLEGLKYIEHHWGRENTVQCFADSQLLIEQLNGRYKVKAPHLIPLIEQMRSLAQAQVVTYQHIPRERNSAADKLVNDCLDQHKKR